MIANAPSSPRWCCCCWCSRHGTAASSSRPTSALILPSISGSSSGACRAVPELVRPVLPVARGCSSRRPAASWPTWRSSSGRGTPSCATCPSGWRRRTDAVAWWPRRQSSNEPPATPEPRTDRAASARAPRVPDGRPDTASDTDARAASSFGTGVPAPRVEARTLATVGAFRLVPADDLRRCARGSPGPATSSVWMRRA